MKKNTLKLLIITAFMITAICCTQLQTNNNVNNNANTSNAGNAVASADLIACVASADWVSNPALPTEIPDNGATLCDFYQFSWQAFLALMNQSGGTRAFQDQQNFPLFLGSADSCGSTTVDTRLFVRTLKDDETAAGDFVLPLDINQAGKDAPVIYDQNGNVVYYEVRFSRSECTQDPTKKEFTDPTTTELKVSYRVITEADKPNYVWINADIDGDGTTEPNELLGMVGFHLVRATAQHPEFVWATFEHKSNVPECQAQPDAAAKYSFASASCAAQLPNSVNSKECAFNDPPTPSGTPVLTGGPPTQICRAYHDSTKTGDNQYESNIADIDALNTQLVGADGFITALSASNSLAVLKNYMLVGAIWVTDPKTGSDLANQRGSIQLANSTMETTFQGAKPYTGTGSLGTATNCFACHGYTPGENVNQSHIFGGIKGQQKTN